MHFHFVGEGTEVIAKQANIFRLTGHCHDGGGDFAKRGSEAIEKSACSLAARAAGYNERARTFCRRKTVRLPKSRQTHRRDFT